MKEIVVVSGKGGTGKTSLTAAFAHLAGESVVCDADVDAADLHLLLAPRIEQQTDFMGGGLAMISRDRCDGCGLCRELCRFDAIGPDYVVDAISCEGCGVCVDLCPAQAIDFPIQKFGEWFISSARTGPGSVSPRKAPASWSAWCGVRRESWRSERGSTCLSPTVPRVSAAR